MTASQGQYCAYQYVSTYWRTKVLPGMLMVVVHGMLLRLYSEYYRVVHWYDILGVCHTFAWSSEAYARGILKIRVSLSILLYRLLLVEYSYSSRKDPTMHNAYSSTSTICYHTFTACSCQECPPPLARVRDTSAGEGRRNLYDTTVAQGFTRAASLDIVPGLQRRRSCAPKPTCTQSLSSIRPSTPDSRALDPSVVRSVI